MSLKDEDLTAGELALNGLSSVVVSSSLSSLSSATDTSGGDGGCIFNKGIEFGSSKSKSSFSVVLLLLFSASEFCVPLVGLSLFDLKTNFALFFLSGRHPPVKTKIKS